MKTFFLFLILSFSAYTENIASPLESLKKSIALADAEKWNEHFSYSFHRDDLKMLNEIREKDPINFITMYKEKKVPRQKQCLEQLEKVQPIYGTINGEKVALLILSNPVKSTKALLLYLQDNRYVLKNSSSLNEDKLKNTKKLLTQQK